MSSIASNIRIRLVAYLTLTVLAFVILAAGISGLQFQTGDFPLDARESEIAEEEIVEERRTVSLAPIEVPRSLQAILRIVIIILVPFAVFAAYRSRELRAGLLLILIFAGLYLFVFRVLYNNYYDRAEVGEAEIQELIPEPDRTPAQGLEDPPDLVGWVSAATTMGILVAVGVVAVVTWRRRQKLLGQKLPLDIISDEAEAALADIRGGASLRDAVLHCYYEMSQALKTWRGLERRDGMTPREFEELQQESGLPEHSLRQLTRLFEKVRYGGQMATEREKREAMDCLQAIVQATQPQA